MKVKTMKNKRNKSEVRFTPSKSLAKDDDSPSDPRDGFGMKENVKKSIAQTLET